MTYKSDRKFWTESLNYWARSFQNNVSLRGIISNRLIGFENVRKESIIRAAIGIQRAKLELEKLEYRNI